ncbi:unnamed protein product [Ectocarpus sp. CCAP 1310/34]|nr:unnamed protein product [Ectocarpus sp. CCAP 1310/34]
MQHLLCLLAFFLAALIPSVAGFLVVPRSPLNSSRQSCRAALQAQEEDAAATTPPGSSDDVCPGYPRCSGEYRDRGCDGTGRISGGVGALVPWLPIKAYRPCPSFTEAKYKYTRQGQSLNEVVFARRQGTMDDITMDDSFGAMKEADDGNK